MLRTANRGMADQGSADYVLTGRGNQQDCAVGQMLDDSISRSTAAKEDTIKVYVKRHYDGLLCSQEQPKEGKM